MDSLIIEERRILLTHEGDDGDTLFRIVDGTPEARTVDARSTIRAYRNRDALALGKPVNTLGTLLYRELGIVDEREVVRGNVVFLGVDGEGAVTDVPAWVVELAKMHVPSAAAICDTLTGRAN